MNQFIRPRSIALFALLVLAPIAGPARAAHPGGCGGSWGPAAKSCNFGLEGLPLRIGGDAQTASGTASIHVRATITLTTGAQTVLECSDSAPLFASCEAQLSVPLGEIDAYTGLLPLQCRVSGTGTGRYGCSTPGVPQV